MSLRASTLIGTLGTTLFTTGLLLQLSSSVAQGQTLREKVIFANSDINRFWQRTFISLRKPWLRPKSYGYRRSVRTPCGQASLNNAIYCVRNHSIYLNYALLNQANRQTGDFGAITIVAHEYGHAVQSQLGLSRRNKYLFQEELQADCFAGVYALDANRRGLLESNDVSEGYRQSYLSGRPHFNPNSHGTYQQRARAFYRGFTHGFRSCLAYSELD